MKLDPRTKLFILAFTGVLIFMNNRIEVEILFILVPLILFALLKECAFVLKEAIIYLFLLLVQFYISPLLFNSAGGIIYIFAMYIRKLIPCYMLGRYIITTTKVSQFMAALHKMNLPKGFSIALTISLRYFPTMKEEWSYIKDAMLLRGISTSFFGFIRRPFQTLEYVYVPMLVSASKISDEITQAAITRGIDHVNRRTSIEKIGFTVSDFVVFIVCALIFILFVIM